MSSFCFAGLALRTVSMMFLWSRSSVVYAKTFIVDDSDTDRIHYVSNRWNVGNTCTGCYAHPNRTRVYGETWHDATNDSSDVSFTFNFTGTAVETHYIAIDFVSSWTTNTHVKFWIDGAQTGSTIREPMNKTDYFYHQTLFRISGLENTEHMLQVELHRRSMLLLDYLAYETEDGEASSIASHSAGLPSPTSIDDGGGPHTTHCPTDVAASRQLDPAQPSSVNIGAIIGIAITSAILVFVVFVILLLYILRRREGKLQGNPNASQVLNASLPQHSPSRRARNSRLKSEPLGHTKKSTILDLSSPKEPPSPYSTASNSRSPGRHAKPGL